MFGQRMQHLIGISETVVYMLLATPQMPRYDCVFPTDLLHRCSGSFIFGVYALALSLRSHVMCTCSQLSCFVFAVGVPSLVYMLLRYPSDYTL